MICVSLMGETVEELRRKACRAMDLGGDLLEFRLDGLRDPFTPEVKELVEEFHERAIITIREKDEGGGYGGSFGRKMKFLRALIELKPMYIDLELRKVDEKILKDLDRGELIISWHDFSGTPDRDVLEEIVERALDLGRIAKIVTYASKISDQIRVLKLYRRFDPRRLIAFSMGELGTISRILSSRLGSPITYVSLPGEPTAPGQPSIEEYLELMELWG